MVNKTHHNMFHNYIVTQTQSVQTKDCSINWNVESAPVKTDINIFFAEQSAKAIRLLNTH